MILPKSFYQGHDVVQIAKALLGKYLVTNFDGKVTSGMIVETEAYSGINDRASHSYNGRFTARTEIMYKAGGTAYIYLCYGIHSLFNIVTNTAGIPDAVLIRGIIPCEGIELMMQRTNKNRLSKNDGSGPGKVSKLLGIHYSMSGFPMTAPDENNPLEKLVMWLEDRGKVFSDSEITITPRIGVDYAGEDAKLLWRFVAKS